MSKINTIKVDNVSYEIEDKTKQPILTAGDNITIEDNVISAESGSSNGFKIIDTTQSNKINMWEMEAGQYYTDGNVMIYTTKNNSIAFSDSYLFVRVEDINRYVMVLPLSSSTEDDKISYYRSYLFQNTAYTTVRTYSFKNFLTNNNIDEYTPTSDYNPATKKYVDDIATTYTGYDATKTQVLKNINGTLTWVNEELEE